MSSLSQEPVVFKAGYWVDLIRFFFHDMDTEDHCFGSLEKGSSIDLQVNRGRKRLVRRFGVSGMGPRCFLTSEPPSHRRFNDRAGIRNPDRRFVET